MTPRFDKALSNVTDTELLLKEAWDMLVSLADAVRSVMAENGPLHGDLRLKALLGQAEVAGLIPHPPVDYKNLHPQPHDPKPERYATGWQKTEPEPPLGDVSVYPERRIVNGMIARLRGDKRLPHVLSDADWEIFKPLRERLAELFSNEMEKAEQAVHRPALRAWFASKVIASISPFEFSEDWRRISGTNVNDMVQWSFRQACGRGGS